MEKYDFGSDLKIFTQKHKPLKKDEIRKSLSLSKTLINLKPNNVSPECNKFKNISPKKLNNVGTKFKNANTQQIISKNQIKNRVFTNTVNGKNFAGIEKNHVNSDFYNKSPQKSICEKNLNSDEKAFKSFHKARNSFDKSQTFYELNSQSPLLNAEKSNIFEKSLSKLSSKIGFQSKVKNPNYAVDHKKSDFGRSELGFLKKNLTKYNCNLSILDFWSTEMKSNANKYLKSKSKHTHTSSVATILPSIRHRKSIFESENNLPRSMNDSISDIIKACNEAQFETAKLKTELESGIINLKKQ